MPRALARRYRDKASFVTTSELGLPAIAYLRSLAEGVPMADAAKRYLNASAPDQARKAHRAVVEHVRTLARRRGDPAWRLIGVELGEAAARRPNMPSLSEWAEAEGLDGWRESELLESSTRSALRQGSVLPPSVTEPATLGFESAAWSSCASSSARPPIRRPSRAISLPAGSIRQRPSD